MKLSNILISCVCMVVMLLLIYFRSGMETWFAQKFHTVKEFSIEKYPTDISSISKLWNQHYKWAFTFSFTVVFSMASLGCIWFLFPFKSVFISTVVIFSSAIALILFFSLMNVFTHDYKLGFGIVLYLKKMLQTPYLTLFLVLYFWKVNNPYLANPRV